MPEYPRSPFEKTGTSITPNVDGDTLDATIIGGTTPAAGSFTTLTSTTNKLDATADPTVDDDTDLGYVVGSRWIDVTADKEYVCLDDTNGAAVWTETTDSSSDVINDTSPQLGGNLDMGTYKLVGEGGSDGVYVDANGLVGVGTNDPGSKLVVIGNTVFSGGANIGDIINSPVAGGLRFARESTNEPFLLFENDGGANDLSQVRGVNGGGLRITSGDSAATWVQILSTGDVGIGTTTPTERLDIDSDKLRLRTAKTPASAGADGNQGDIAWDASYLYICISTNTWKRSLIETW